MIIGLLVLFEEKVENVDHRVARNQKISHLPHHRAKELNQLSGSVGDVE
jgi:hypothetical protein